MNAFVTAWRVSRFLPIWFIRALARAGAWLVWARRGTAVRRLEDNLHRVTGFEDRRMRRLSRHSMYSTARYYAELLELGRMRLTAIHARVRTVAMDRVRADIEHHGTVGVVLAHSGNWDLVGAWTCANLGAVRTVAEILEPREAFDAFVAMREEVGMTVLGHEGSGTFRKLIAIAKNDGGVMALLADRDLSGDGIVTSMWGHQVRVAPGPAALALATKITLYPLFVRYERLHGLRRWRARSRWGTVMDFGPPVHVPEGTKQQQLQSMTDQWTAFLASRIKDNPEDWHMMQRFGWVE